MMVEGLLLLDSFVSAAGANAARADVEEKAGEIEAKSAAYVESLAQRLRRLRPGLCQLIYVMFLSR
jgi:hypothetical protein